MESRGLYLKTAQVLTKIMKGKDWYYKASFDKPSRSSVEGKRGPGLEKGLVLFAEVKKLIPEIKLTTDVHETHQVKKLKSYIDCIQIPAFNCRQTDLLVECGQHFKRVNIKKGQWINPQNALHFVGKVRQKNRKAKVWLTERGTFFGYERLVVDFRTVGLFKKHFDKVILDCTHSTQFMKEGFVLGDRELAEKYLQAASIFGYDGLFAEVHPHPEKAITDGTSQIYLKRIEKLIQAYEMINKVLVSA